MATAVPTEDTSNCSERQSSTMLAVSAASMRAFRSGAQKTTGSRSRWGGDGCRRRESATNNSRSISSRISCERKRLCWMNAFTHYSSNGKRNRTFTTLTYKSFTRTWRLHTKFSTICGDSPGSPTCIGATLRRFFFPAFFPTCSCVIFTSSRATLRLLSICSSAGSVSCSSGTIDGPATSSRHLQNTLPSRLLQQPQHGDRLRHVELAIAAQEEESQRGRQRLRGHQHRALQTENHQLQRLRVK